MWCLIVRNRLSAYTDGELAPSDARGVEEHLARCERCAAERARLQQVVRLTALVPCEEMPFGLQSRILSRLAIGDGASFPTPRPWSFRLPSLTPRGWALAAGALAVLAFGMMRQAPLSGSRLSGETPVVAVQPVRRVRTAVRREPAAPHRMAAVSVAPKPREERARAEAPIIEARESLEPAVKAARDAAPPAAPARRNTVRLVGGSAVLRENRPQPQPVPVNGGKAATEPREAEPPSEPVGTAPVEMAAMPGDAVMNTMMVTPPPDSVAAGMEKEPGTRMAGMATDSAPTPDEDEGVRSLRMFLEDRNKMVPQPPLQPPMRDRRGRKSL